MAARKGTTVRGKKPPKAPPKAKGAVDRIIKARKGKKGK